jgi:hypothetical protein
MLATSVLEPKLDEMNELLDNDRFVSVVAADLWMHLANVTDTRTLDLNNAEFNRRRLKK